MPSKEEKRAQALAAHVGNVKIVHNSMKAATKTIAEADPASFDAEKLKNFCQFINAFAIFLHHHHDHEEQIVFPNALSVDQEKIKPVIDQLEKDHHDLITKIDRIIEITKTPATATVENAIEAKTLVSEFKDFLSQHFDVETTELDVKFYERYTDALLQKEINAILAANKAAGHPELNLAFLFTNIPDEDRAVMIPLFPWIVRRFLLPIWLNKHAQVWKDFSAHTKVNARGRIVT